MPDEFPANSMMAQRILTALYLDKDERLKQVLALCKLIGMINYDRYLLNFGNYTGDRINHSPTYP
jgi:hypothetical protein